jgi:DNA-binding CsgD family transcriptional regulator
MTTAALPIRRTTPHLPSKCGQHPRYTAGCPHCQHHARIREAARHKAVILGTHTSPHVPAIGTARRLQGLTAEGHSAPTLARLLGIGINPVKQWRAHLTPRVTRHTHHMVVALVRRLDGVPGSSGVARSHAEQQGWVPVAAWDDIDDPDAQPVPGSIPGRLVDDVLHGLIPATVLDVSDLGRLWAAWTVQQTDAGLTCSRSEFARRFQLGEWQARQAVAAAQTSTTPNPAATGRTRERTAA